jgi:hypothetical protein
LLPARRNPSAGRPAQPKAEAPVARLKLPRLLQKVSAGRPAKAKAEAPATTETAATPKGKPGRPAKAKAEVQEGQSKIKPVEPIATEAAPVMESAAETEAGYDQIHLERMEEKIGKLERQILKIQKKLLKMKKRVKYAGK